MATAVDLITFFGVGSFFAWLGFAPLQKELLDRFKSRPEKASKNFYRINDYFLVSFLCYSADMIAEYLVSATSLAILGTNPYYDSAPVQFLVLVLFLAGIVTLAAPIWYLRRVQNGDINLEVVSIPDFFYALLVASITIISFTIAIAGVVLATPWFRQLGWGAIAIATLFGAKAMMDSYENPRGRIIAALIVMVPLFLLFVF